MSHYSQVGHELNRNDSGARRQQTHNLPPQGNVRFGPDAEYEVGVAVQTRLFHAE